MSALALPAFLSSAVSTSVLHYSLLYRCSSLPDAFKDQLLAGWGSLFGAFPVGSAAHKQSAWDSPGIKSDKSLILSGLQSPGDRAVFLASSFPHSGAWLAALPIAACGLRLDDEAVRVGVALRLGLRLCVAHECPCGATVDTWGTHALVCKRAPARLSRHHAVNDVIAHALTSAGVPVLKEPRGILRSSSLRPDGLTLIPWQGGKALAWDATIATTLADSYLGASATLAGSAAELAASKKLDKYTDLSADYLFQPVALESLGPVSSTTSAFLSDLGKRISSVSGASRSE